MDEPLTSPCAHRRRGGWRTFPFITSALVGTGIATGGCSANLTVYLIGMFNIGDIDAVQISSIVSGCINVAPIVMAVIADSILGSFLLISASISSSLLAMLLFSLTATLDFLRPLPCSPARCEGPTGPQLLILYLSIGFWVAGVGGTRLNPATMGANQFDDPGDQGSFFNWYLFAMNTAALAGVVGVVYVQDEVGWGWGFGLCAAIVASSLVLFLAGRTFYRQPKQRENPFSGAAKVEEDGADCYLKIDGDADEDHSVVVVVTGDSDILEELKVMLKLLPLFLSSIPTSTATSMQTSLTVLQAMVMDRGIGAAFQIPAGSMVLFNFLSIALLVCIFDRAVFPLCRTLTGRSPTPLQRVGLGYLLCAVAMAWSAQVESSRLAVSATQKMSAFQLVPPIVLMGMGEALHYPGNMTLYYQEFPASMKSVATGLVAVSTGVGFYLSAAVIGVVRRFTGWLQDDIDRSRVDLVYWMMALVGMVNFGYYLLCVKYHRRRTHAETLHDENS